MNEPKSNVFHNYKGCKVLNYKFCLKYREKAIGIHIDWFEFSVLKVFAEREAVLNSRFIPAYPAILLLASHLFAYPGVQRLTRLYSIVVLRSIWLKLIDLSSSMHCLNNQ